MNMLRSCGTISFAIACCFAGGAVMAQVPVLTNRYDALRTGLNSHETILTTTNVNVQSFGKLYAYSVDGSVFAQPLYVPNQAIPNQGTHNAVYVATMNDSVYAFDADANVTLWHVNFTNPAKGITPVPIQNITGGKGNNIVGFVGIESTPVIDPATETMYLVARTKEVSGSVKNFVQRLHALDITTGAEKFGGPVVITASSVGTGEQSSGGLVPFNPKNNNQRSGLALTNGQIIIAWSSHEDIQPYHGWVMAYDAATLTQTAAFCTTPNGQQGGVWMAGRAPVVDGNGFVYFSVGNGTTDSASDYSEAELKLSVAAGLQMTDYFLPSNTAALNTKDLDFGSGGPLMLPGTGLLAGGDKQGILYLLNSAHLGHQKTGDTQIPQKLKVNAGRIYVGPAYWESASLGPLLYLWGANDALKAWHFNGQTLDTTPLMKGNGLAGQGSAGAALTISANGSADGTGIVWAPIESTAAANGVVPGMLRALNASDLSQELWNSLQMPSRDDTGYFARFVPPLVDNGKVYLATFSDYQSPNVVNVYGLLPQGSAGARRTATARPVAEVK